jgi:hypothetical protein
MFIHPLQMTLGSLLLPMINQYTGTWKTTEENKLKNAGNAQ